MNKPEAKEYLEMSALDLVKRINGESGSIEQSESAVISPKIAER